MLMNKAADERCGHTVAIGILGGGQLAKMLALGGLHMGAKFITLDPAQDACASVVSRHIVGKYDDRSKLDGFTANVDVVTYEFENVPPESVKLIAKKLPVYPPPQALAVARDRLKEKTLFWELGIPTPKFSAVSSLDDLKRAVWEIGLPSVLKCRTMGYDGKGQAVIKMPEDIESAWTRLGETDCILETYIPFTREVSVIAVRGGNGETAFYPICENTHVNGILRHTVCMLNDPSQKTAEDYIMRILDYFGYVGVLTLELFDAKGTLMANEIAPRVHNTGHWTIEGARTSQFENHIRAICGLPIGDTSASCFCAMVNFIGALPQAQDALKIKGTHFHSYGKSAKPGRKLGHATICGDNIDEVKMGLEKLLKTCQFI